MGWENSAKNPLSQTRCICGWPLKYYLNQSSLLKRHYDYSGISVYCASATLVFLVNFWIFQKQPPDVWKSLKIMKSLTNFAISTGKLHACKFIQNRLQDRCFPLNIAKFLRSPISKNICSVSNCFCIDSFIKFR